MKTQEQRRIKEDIINLMSNSNTYKDNEIKDFTLWIDGLINESDKNSEELK